MVEESNRASLAVTALLLGVGLMSAQIARAQAPAPQSEAPASEAPAPEAPKELTGADFAIEAGAVEERLSRIRTEMSLIDVLAEVTKALDEVDA